MPRPSFNVIISGLFLAYILHSIYTIYLLFTPPVCPPDSHCIKPYLDTKPKLQLVLYSSTKEVIRSASDLSLLWEWENVDVDATHQGNVNVSLPASTRNNGSLYVHAYLIPKFQATQQRTQAAHLISSPFASYATAPLTLYMVSEAKAFNLLSTDEEVNGTASKKKKKANAPTAHWKSKLGISIMNEKVEISARQVPSEIMKFIKLSPQREYLPILYVDSLNSRIKDVVEIKSEDSQCELSITYSPISYGKLRLYSQVESAMQTLTNLGFQEKDLDEIKGIFMDTNLYLLCLTFVVAALHLLFDFLAFKNDISYWRKRKTMVGLSTKTLIWRCISQTILFFYLLDENTSQLVLIPAGIGALIEVWKLTKAFKLFVRFDGLIPKFQFGATSSEELETEQYDTQSMKYLSYVLYPLCIGGAIYSLLYTPHKSWYSWSIQCLANGVYAFGFLFMLPQLFVNYKHKSVAHLPWKAFMYKAFNTFIDDVFAFIIAMPTAHRVACFRDDVVFLIYLYQRWLYPVDKTRINEFGESFDDNNSNKVTNSKKTR